MEDLDSAFSSKCIHCGQELPLPDCPVPECHSTPEVTPEVTTEVAPVLAHEETTVICQVCERTVAAGEMCDRPDCPRVAVEQIRKASIDTPFKLGL